MLYGVLDLIFLGLAIAAFGMSVWALIHAIRTPARAFQAAGKLNKNLWMLFTGLATIFTLASAAGYMGGGLNMLNIFTIASVIASGIYLADVKPAVSEYKGGGGGNQGPYGPW
ncbi:DUF2516 family protein [Herbidospora sp. NEAU-GS84]|uniref:DUF2516 family protein n=1 Tax=Herbidospora solisilvae TaxID=2696284 RepID=A0A7C9NA09_9ACTN|nr:MULTISPECIES: DUF2516 family protein [Herbidospora]NAS25413.1 DUF2516 family protein [Herbidospora solisilvae]GLX95836.1 hypothetical protein Hesp01_37860 [Herbidospora sp. NBRC 101105]